MVAGFFGFEDLLCSWDRLMWELIFRALRICRGGNFRVLQLMLRLWCFFRVVYQVGFEIFFIFFGSLRNRWGMVGKGCKVLLYVQDQEVCSNKQGEQLILIKYYFLGIQYRERCFVSNVQLSFLNNLIIKVFMLLFLRRGC